MEERYIATMVLHGLGDTIGYKNSEWEFKRGRIESNAVEKLYEFIDLGGVNSVPGKGWIVSDDTVMHVATAKTLVSEWDKFTVFMENLTKEYVKAYDSFMKEGVEKRYPGKALLKYLGQLKDGVDWESIPYDIYAGGSGASMRTSCIGLASYGKDSRDNLVALAVETSRITHNSAVGYLGGVTSALFTALAIEGVDILKWPTILMDIFPLIDVYIKGIFRDVDKYQNDKHVFIDKWKRYIDNKFDDEQKLIKRRIDKNIQFRTTYYYDNYGYKRDNVQFPGSGGDDSVIISYDCLVDSGGSWEKLVVYAMLHGGDTDTTGSIAGSWYGAMYGFKDVPMNVLKNLENRSELENLGKALYKKWYSENRK